MIKHRKQNTQKVTYRETSKTAKPTKDKVARAHKRFDIAAKVFAIASAAFVVLLFLAIFTGVTVIGDIAIATVFLIWFPSLVVSANAANYVSENDYYLMP